MTTSHNCRISPQLLAHSAPRPLLTRGLRRFLISSEGLTYELSFIERLLNTSNVEDIKNALGLVIDRVQTRAVPRRMNFGAMAEHAAAVQVND